MPWLRSVENVKARSTRTPRPRSTLVSETREIIQYGCDKISMSGVLRRQSCGVQVQDVTRLGGSLGPRRGGNRRQLAFEIGLPVSQFPRVVLNLHQGASEVSRLLSRHTAVLVEIECFNSHPACSRRYAAHRLDRLTPLIWSGCLKVTTASEQSHVPPFANLAPRRLRPFERPCALRAQLAICFSHHGIMDWPPQRARSPFGIVP
jgi:hypothetical protein